MRERERLDDFQGGAVACRGCKRLLYFDLATLTPIRCCTFAYVPSQRQVDLIIYDKLVAGDLQDVAIQEAPAPLVIAPTAYDETMGDTDEAAVLPDPYLEEEEEISDAAIDILAITAEQVQERKAERLAQIKRRVQ